MKWMKSKEPECQIILVSAKTETSTESLVGFQTLMWSVQRTTMSDIRQIVNTLMGQWIIMLLSITQRWLTLNSLDKMLQVSRLLEKEFRLWAFKINLSMDPAWDQLLVLFKHRFMLHLLFWTVIFQTNGEITKKCMKLNNLLTVFHFWELLILNGINLPNLQQETKTKKVQEVSHKVPITPLPQDFKAWITKTKEKELNKSKEKTAGTPMSNLSLNTINKSMDPWKFHSKEFDKIKFFNK